MPCQTGPTQDNFPTRVPSQVQEQILPIRLMQNKKYRQKTSQISQRQAAFSLHHFTTVQKTRIKIRQCRLLSFSGRRCRRRGRRDRCLRFRSRQRCGCIHIFERRPPCLNIRNDLSHLIIAGIVRRDPLELIQRLRRHPLLVIDQPQEITGVRVMRAQDDRDLKFLRRIIDLIVLIIEIAKLRTRRRDPADSAVSVPEPSLSPAPYSPPGDKAARAGRATRHNHFSARSLFRENFPPGPAPPGGRCYSQDPQKKVRRLHERSRRRDIPSGIRGIEVGRFLIARHG